MGAKIRFCRRCGTDNTWLYPVLPADERSDHVVLSQLSDNRWPHWDQDQRYDQGIYWCSVCISDHNGELGGWNFNLPITPATR